MKTVNELAEEYHQSLRPFIASYKTERVSAYTAGYNAAIEQLNAKLLKAEQENERLREVLQNVNDFIQNAIDTCQTVESEALKLREALKGESNG